MMVLSLFGLIQKHSKILILASLSFLVVFVVFYVQNLYKYRQALTNTGVYIESQITPFSPEVSKHKVGDNVIFEWEVSTPVNRIADKTFVMYGSQSSPSATMYQTDPQKMPYPIKTSDYLMGGYVLPYKFTTNVVFDTPGVVFYRFYAKVDGRDLYSPEYSLEVRN